MQREDKKQLVKAVVVGGIGLGAFFFLRNAFAAEQEGCLPGQVKYRGACMSVEERQQVLDAEHLQGTLDWNAESEAILAGEVAKAERKLQAAFAALMSVYPSAESAVVEGLWSTYAGEPGCGEGIDWRTAEGAARKRRAERLWAIGSPLWRGAGTSASPFGFEREVQIREATRKWDAYLSNDWRARAAFACDLAGASAAVKGRWSLPTSVVTALKANAARVPEFKPGRTILADGVRTTLRQYKEVLLARWDLIGLLATWTPARGWGNYDVPANVAARYSGVEDGFVMQRHPDFQVRTSTPFNASWMQPIPLRLLPGQGEPATGSGGQQRHTGRTAEEEAEFLRRRQNRIREMDAERPRVPR